MGGKLSGNLFFTAGGGVAEERRRGGAHYQGHIPRIPKDRLWLQPTWGIPLHTGVINVTASCRH